MELFRMQETQLKFLSPPQLNFDLGFKRMMWESTEYLLHLSALNIQFYLSTLFNADLICRNDSVTTKGHFKSLFFKIYRQPKESFTVCDFLLYNRLLSAALFTGRLWIICFHFILSLRSSTVTTILCTTRQP